MKIEVIGTETLGVRGLSSVVEAGGSRILIDPGVALGFTRYSLHPHPLQAVVGDEVKYRIVKEWGRAQDIVISHLHGDHTPLPNPNPFQLGIDDVTGVNPSARIWVKGERFTGGVERFRLKELERRFGDQVAEARPGGGDGILEFIGPFPHTGASRTLVLGTIIRGDKTVVHLSDADLSRREVVETVKRVDPDVVIADGPSLYRSATSGLSDRIMTSASQLAGSCETLIVDHHLMRCDRGITWLKALQEARGGSCRILCAAEFMMRPLMMLEAWRRTLYRLIPASNDWFKSDLLLRELKTDCREIWPEIRSSLYKARPRNERDFEDLLSISLEN